MKRHFDADDKTTVARREVSADGKTRYFRMMDGSLRRADPKPWCGKAERRLVLKQRREERAA